MNANERTADALTNRANSNIAQLISRFESIIAYEPDNTSDRPVAAVSSYQMGVESAALVRAAEDILSLTRVLKEAWLFGRLETVGTGGAAEERTRVASGKVVEGVRRLGGEGWVDGVVVGAPGESGRDGRGGGGESDTGGDAEGKGEVEVEAMKE